MTAEFQLVVNACRANFTQADGAGAASVPPLLDWSEVLRIARRHRVQGLVWGGLDKPRGGIDEPAAQTLAREAAAVASTSLRAAAECGRLVGAAAQQGVDLLFLKGILIASLVYRDPFLKMAADIDILVAQQQLGRAAELLERLGYVLVNPRRGSLEAWHSRRKESVWFNATLAIHLDLHTGLSDSPNLIPDVGLTSPRQEVKVAGALLPTLRSEEQFAYLCVHGASSAWFRLKWITDLAALLEGFSGARVAHFYDCSQRLGSGRAAAQALLLAETLYGTARGTALIADLRRDRANLRLERLALRQLQSPGEPTASRLGTWGIHLNQLLLKPGIGFKAGEIMRQLRVATSAVR